MAFIRTGVPLVLGTSAAPGRSATACRRARAAALNAASAAWWAFRAASTSRCSVSRPRSASAWKKSATRVSGNSAVTQLAATSRGALQTKKPRPERSTTARARASSSGA